MARLRARAEDGFTLIEVLITCMLLAVAVVALVGTFDFSRDLTSTAEANEVAAHKAEAAIEKTMSLPFSALALSSMPGGSGDPENPNYYVNGSSYQWNQGSSGSQSEPLVVNTTGGQVAPQVQSWTDGQSRLSGSIYLYVTEVAGTNGRARRVTVAVTVNGTRLRKPVLISSIKADVSN